MEEQTVNRMNKKLIACIVAIILIICGVGGYFYYKRTPTYSLQLIQQSVKDHNWEKFSQHVDTKGLADSVSLWKRIKTTALLTRRTKPLSPEWRS